jgi:hypothetical protein
MADFNSPSTGKITVKLDGLPIEIPSERLSFAAIHSYLELLALRQQRIICALSVDENPMNLTHPRPVNDFAAVEAETMSLEEVPIRLVSAALQQTIALRTRVQSATELVLINDIGQARQLWWELSTTLKEPLLTLSLLPDNICGPDNGRASLIQLRKWQLQQLGRIMEEVDEASNTIEPTQISDILERRLLPWIDTLVESLNLWQETMLTNFDQGNREQTSLHF